MAILVAPLAQFSDSRGTIRDLLVGEQFDSVTLIRSKVGAVRGNHYHAETVQWTYVVSGRLRVVTQVGDSPPVDGIVSDGELMVSPAGECHAWLALEDTEVLVFTRGPRSGANYESDTVRLTERLIP
jgi:quercetin dioxygenase-like cupin family protein